MQSPTLYYALLLTDLLLGLGVGWVLGAGYTRQSLARRRTPGRGDAQVLGGVSATMSRQAAELGTFTEALRQIGPRDSAALQTRVQAMHESSKSAEKQLWTEQGRLAQLAAANEKIWGRLFLKVSGHCSQLDRFCQLLESCLGDRLPGDAMETLIDAVAELSVSNEDLTQAISEAERRIGEQDERLREAERDARVDRVTRLPSALALDERLTSMQHRLTAGQPGFALVLLDVDHMADLNRNCGQAAGDAALAVCGRLASESARSQDYVARFGGDEFAALLPGASLAEARRVAETCRERVERAEVRVEGGMLSFTVSAGVVTARRGETTAELLARARASLGWAKSFGRNRVAAEPEGTEARDGKRLAEPVPA